MLQFIEFLKVENDHGTLETVEREFCVDTTEDKLRAEFEQFVPDHDTAENPTITPSDFWSKEKQFARTKMMEWRAADRSRCVGDNVHDQIINIIKEDIMTVTIETIIEAAHKVANISGQDSFDSWCDEPEFNEDYDCDPNEMGGMQWGDLSGELEDELGEEVPENLMAEAMRAISRNEGFGDDDNETDPWYVLGMLARREECRLAAARSAERAEEEDA